MQNINIDGTERKFYLGTKEIDMIESRHDAGIGYLTGQKRMGIGVMVTCLWAGLSRYCDEYLEEVGREKLLQVLEDHLKSGKQTEKFKEIGTIISKALEESGVFAKDKKKEPSTS